MIWYMDAPDPTGIGRAVSYTSVVNQTLRRECRTAGFSSAKILLVRLWPWRSTPEVAHAANQLDWDKTFPKSEKVEHRKVNFKNRYGHSTNNFIHLLLSPIATLRFQKRMAGSIVWTPQPKRI
jgi:hypothetical protein